MLYGRDGRTIYELDHVIKSGGEGIVHAIQGRPGSVAKIYKPERISDPQLRARTEAKILAMLDMHFNPHSGNRVIVAWPEDALYGRDGSFQGFVMPRIDNMKSLIWASRPADRAVLWPNGYRWRYSMAIAFNLASAIEQLHSGGIVVGDMNPKNILINAKGMVTLIDTDSFNIASKGKIYKCIVGVADYLPPELQGKDLSRANSVFSEKTDCFSLAIHIFSLLCNNCHPFGCLKYNVAQGSVSMPKIMDNIVRGYCPYVSASPAKTVDDALDMDVFPSDLRRLFVRAFRYDMATAVKRATINTRPSAEEWRTILGKLYHHLYKASGVAVCRRDPLHEFPRDYHGGCPWCAINQHKASSSVVAPPPAGTPVQSSSGQRISHRPPLRHTNSQGGGLWAEYDAFISNIGKWFKDNGETIGLYTSFSLLGIAAIGFVVDVVRIWRSGHPFSAIFTAIIGGGIAYYVGLIAAVIINMCVQGICFVLRWVFRNAAWFTTILALALGACYVATHEDLLIGIQTGVSKLSRIISG